MGSQCFTGHLVPAFGGFQSHLQSWRLSSKCVFPFKLDLAWQSCGSPTQHGGVGSSFGSSAPWIISTLDHQHRACGGTGSPLPRGERVAQCSAWAGDKCCSDWGCRGGEHEGGGIKSAAQRLGQFSNQQFSSDFHPFSK